MIVHVVAVGRVRDAALRAACDEYARRVRRYVRLDIHEVQEAGRRAPDASAAQRLEAERLRAAMPAGAQCIALTRAGTLLTGSRALAERVDEWRVAARDVAVLIGGAYGIAPDLLASCERLSLSHLTLPHELARLVWLEQLYRAGTILRGEPYHKGE